MGVYALYGDTYDPHSQSKPAADALRDKTVEENVMHYQYSKCVCGW